MPEFLNHRRIGPETEEYEKLEAVRKSIGSDVRQFLEDDALPMKRIEETRFKTRCELHGGDSFEYSFTLSTTDEASLRNLFSSGIANQIAHAFYGFVTNYLELAPSALIRLQFNSWEWFASHRVSPQTLFRNGDERFEHQLFVDSGKRLYSRGHSAVSAA